MGIHDHDAAGLAVVGFDGGLELALADVLDALIDGQRQVAPRLGLLEHLGGEAALAHVGEHAHGSGHALQVIVQAHLEAGVAALLVVDAAQEMGRESLLGVEATALGAEFDPVQTQAAQPLGLLRRDLALDPEKAAVLGMIESGSYAEAERGGVEIENTAQDLAGHGGIGDTTGIHAHRIYRQAHGQRLAVAVGDDAAGGGNFDVLEVLGVGHLVEFGVRENLQVDETPEDAGRPQYGTTHQQIEATRCPVLETRPHRLTPPPTGRLLGARGRVHGEGALGFRIEINDASGGRLDELFGASQLLEPRRVQQSGFAEVQSGAFVEQFALLGLESFNIVSGQQPIGAGQEQPDQQDCHQAGSADELPAGAASGRVSGPDHVRVVDALDEEVDIFVRQGP